MQKYDAALIEKSLDRGLTAADCEKLFGMLKQDEVLPLDIQDETLQSAHMGFITIEASERLDYKHENLAEAVKEAAKKIWDMNAPATRTNNVTSFNDLEIYVEI